MTHLLKAENLGFSYGTGRVILEGINFSLSPGEIVGITGASGSGKTTLAYCLCGIIPHIYGGSISGAVNICGTDASALTLPQIAQKVGVVFQSPDMQLFSGTVEDDVVFGPENLCLEWGELDERLCESLDSVNIAELRRKNPKTLSGGQAQLTALAAVLALRPQAPIFDEAFSQLDEDNARLLTERAVGLKNGGRGVIIIDHDAARLQIADRVLVLEEGLLRER